MTSKNDAAYTVTLTFADAEHLIKSLELEAIDFDLTAFYGIGLMNSHLYRARFMNLAKAANLTPNEIFIIITLTVAIKNKARILTYLDTNDQVKKAKWHPTVRKFIQVSCSQYTTESNNRLMPVVKIPESLPSIAAVSWVKINAKRNPTADMLLQNLWAASLFLNDEAQEFQKAWEVEFWEKVATSSKNANRPADVNFKFHDKFYESKQNDKYILTNKAGVVIRPANESGYSKEELNAFIKGWKA